jgi:methionyl-tRNA formyltransferase
MKIVFFGTPAFSCGPLRALLCSPHTVAGVVTGPDKPQGRHLRLLPPPVKEAALQHGLPVFQCADVNSGASVEQIRRLCPDLFVVVSYGSILGRELLAVPRQGAINLHTSLLPELRGAAPIQRAIAQGKTETGSTIMYMTEKLDAGDIIMQEAAAIDPADTYGTLSDKLALQGAALLVRAVDMIQAGAVIRIPQDDSRATCARKFTKDELCIRWEMPAREICDLIRALNPRPCAHTFLGLRGGAAPVKLLKAACAGPEKRGRPGEVLDVSAKGIVVQAGDGTVLIERLQPPGKREMDAASFIHGYKVRNGDTCGSSHTA